ASKLPGLQIADLLPHTAREIHGLCVIRSMISKEGDHERGTYLVKTGYRPDPTIVHPSLGAIVTHELPEAGVEIPRHISILNSQWPARGGFLRDQHHALKGLDPQQNLLNMKGRVEADRPQRRVEGVRERAKPRSETAGPP